jgi:hypothetical protein
MSRASRRLTFDTQPAKRPRETESHDDAAKRSCPFPDTDTAPETQTPWDISEALEHLRKAGLHEIIQVYHSMDC